jgi:hypothetical protein
VSPTRLATLVGTMVINYWNLSSANSAQFARVLLPPAVIADSAIESGPTLIMMDLPTLIALLAPVLLLFVLDQVMRRMLTRRRARAVDVQVPAAQVLGSAAMPIASHPTAQATDLAAAPRRVA